MGSSSAAYKKYEASFVLSSHYDATCGNFAVSELCYTLRVTFEFFGKVLKIR